MEQKVYHGNITPYPFSQSWVGDFNRANFQVQELNYNHQAVVQIAPNDPSHFRGIAAPAITFCPIKGGSSVELGKLRILNVAASLGISALSALANPLNLIFRLGDITRDIKVNLEMNL